MTHFTGRLEVVPRANGLKPFLQGELAFGKFNDTIALDGWSASAE